MSAAAPLLGEIAKLYLKRVLVNEEEDDEEKNATAMTSNSKKNYTAKRTNLLCKLPKNEQTKFTEERYNNKK